VQPFASLDDDERLVAARQSLDQTRTDGDGPLIESACRVALDEERGRLVGAILLTLVPLVDLSDIERSARWEQSPDATRGRPHLTWIFVDALATGHGVGTALLTVAVRDLHDKGFIDLASTFLEGSGSSMLWHWRNGFRLLAHPCSRRELRRRWMM
jgi:GNAT superfamily N-acetyltransferase